jgi:tetratricopeptide (TPR) repeat protein
MSRGLGKTAHHADILEGLAHTLAKVGSADSAVTLARRALKAEKRGKEGETLDTPAEQTDLAQTLFHDPEQQEEAKSLYRQAINRLEEDSNSYSLTQRARAHSNFAYFLNDTGDYADAERYARRAVLLNRRAHGESHYTTRRTRTHLFAALVQQGKYERALAVRRKQLAIAREQYDPPTTGWRGYTRGWGKLWTIWADRTRRSHCSEREWK